jgi:hypothetical protein
MVARGGEELPVICCQWCVWWHWMWDR